MKRIYSILFALVALLWGNSATAQTYFDFCDGDIAPALESTVQKLDVITVDYGNCNATLAVEGLNPGYGQGTGWIVGPDGKKRDVSYGDDYDKHILTIRVIGDPIVVAGDYVLRIPEGMFKCYRNDNIICDAARMVWTVDGSLDPNKPTDTNSQFKVTDIKCTSADGFIITFNENITNVKHNSMGMPEDKCLMFDDLDGNEAQNANTPKKNGNVAIVGKGWGAQIISGHHLIVRLQPQNWIGETGALTGETTFNVTVDEGIAKAEIIVGEYAPADASPRGSLDNIIAKFEPNIRKILDNSLITVENENGHSLKFSSISLNSEGNSPALNINIHEDNVLEEGTTYSCHIKPGAALFGVDAATAKANETEVVFGKWNIKVSPLQLTLDPANNSLAESIKTVTVSAKGDLELIGDYKDVTVNGIMEYQVNEYARCESAVKNADGSYTLTFDKEVTPEMLLGVEIIKGSSAKTDNVKICIPEGVFQSGIHKNANTQAIIVVRHNVEIGELTWSFTPEAGATVAALGIRSIATDEEGATVVSYGIGIKVAGENANVRISDASGFQLLNEMGASTITFSQFDIVSDGQNSWTLNLGAAPKNSSTEYTLIIPKESVDIYNNVEYYGEPTHPEEDIEVTWFIGDPTGINCLKNAELGERIAVSYNLAGQRAVSPKGIVIVNGKKALVK